MLMTLRRHPLVIALVSAVLGIVGCLVVGNLLPEPQELKEPLPHHLASSDRQLRTSMGALFGSNYVPGNKVETLVNGIRIFPAMLTAIREARQTISFETYIYWRGAIAEEFADALSAKSRDGLSVKVLLDWVGSQRMEDEVLKTMTDAGARVELYHPLSWYTIARMNNRTHRKLLVVDGRVGFTGGLNIGAENLASGRKGAEGVRDIHFSVSGPVVRDFLATFEAHFKGMTAEPIGVATLLESRERLLARVAHWLDAPSCAFLESVEDEQPDFSLIGLAHAAELPGVRRKLHNLAQRTAAKRVADRRQLDETLVRIAGAR